MTAIHLSSVLIYFGIMLQLVIYRIGFRKLITEEIHLEFLRVETTPLGASLCYYWLRHKNSRNPNCHSQWRSNDTKVLFFYLSWVTTTPFWPKLSFSSHNSSGVFNFSNQFLECSRSVELCFSKDSLLQKYQEQQKVHISKRKYANKLWDGE